MEDLNTNEIMDMSLIQDDEVKSLKEIAEEQKKQFSGDRFKCGFDIFDGVINGGFEEGNLVIISGVSGQGKTSLGQTMTYNLCSNNIPCLWFSYEVSARHLDSKFESMDIKDFYEVYAPKKNTTGKLEWVKQKIKESWVKYATKVIFIDHLDYLIPKNANTSDSQASYLKQVAIQLKELAIELNVVIVCMAHLKKLDNDREPDMQDIGYSAGIYQNADFVFIIMRKKNKQARGMGEDDIEGEVYSANSIIKLVKNRETGQTKIIKCQYVNEKFIQLTKKYEGNNEDIKRTDYFNK